MIFHIFTKSSLTILGTVLFLLVPCAESAPQAPSSEILWDNYGVPHIFGNSTRDMYYAYGWAQMQNHGDLILKLYGQARGRASEYWGEKYLQSDKQIMLFEIPEHAERCCLLQQEPFKSYLNAFVSGMNDYADKYTDAIGKIYRQILPVTAEDPVAHMLRIIWLEFLAYDDLNAMKNTAGNGSNAIAIAPTRSASGNPMLVTNPHLPWSDFFIWFEAQLASPGFNAYGVTLVGLPNLSIAFNDNLGWTFTVNTIDGADRYELNLKSGGYLWDGMIRPFEKKNKTFRILQDNGSYQEFPAEFRYSVHGPVIAEKGDKAYALRLAGAENISLFDQFHCMAAATNLTEFETALRMLQNPMFNVIYADKNGNILYLFNGNIPVRPEGDFTFWKGTVDGTQSKYLWYGIHPYEDLPRVLNPPSGFVQNCNDAPWFSTYPPVLDPARYPAYMAPQGVSLRPQHALNMVLEDTCISFDELVGYKLNTGMEAADRFLDDLDTAVVQYPDPIATEAMAVLKEWDRKTDVESKGAILFAKWFDKLDHTIFDIPWQAEQPVTTPDGLNDHKKAVDMLILAARETIGQYGKLDVSWGSVYRFRMNNLDFPANGGPGQYGIFRNIDYMIDTDLKNRAVFGDTYVAVTEFGKHVKAMVLLSYGNASQPGNKHIGDQLKLLSAKRLRPALLSRKSIMENLEKKEELIVSWE